MNLQEAYKIGDNLVSHHLPSKWRFEINPRVLSRLGCCKYQQQVIEVSKFVVTQVPSEFVETVLHEIAHAQGRPVRWAWRCLET